MKDGLMGSPEAELTLHALWDDVAAVLWRRRGLVTVVAVTMTAAVYVGLLFVGDKFEAQASLLVKVGRENLEVPVTVERGGMYPTGLRKEEINSYIALITSRPLIEATIQEVGVERFRAPPPRPQTLLGWVKYGLKKCARWGKEQCDEFLILVALKRRLTPEELVYQALEKNLNVRQRKDADVIQLSLRLPDASLARDVLEVLIRRYAARHVEVVRRAPSALQVFEEQARNYGDTLLGLRDKASRLKTELGVSSVAEQKTQLLDMLKVAELGRQEAERELARCQAERQALLRRQATLDELQLAGKLVNPSAARTRIRQSLADLQVERTLALSKYQPDSDPVKKVEAEIATLEAALRAIPAEEDGSRTLNRNPVLVFVESRLAEDEIKSQALEGLMAKIDDQVAHIRTELQRMDLAEAELQKLQLEISVAEARFLANASRREEARSQETLDRWQVVNVTLLSPAASSEKPVSPKRLLIMALGLAGSLLTGVSLALLLEWRGDVIHTPRDLERIAPGAWLGSFPSTPGSGAAKPRFARLSRWLASRARPARD